MATRSIPTVSRRPASRAISVLVPTPSVAAASRRPSPIRNNPANPPTDSTTSGRVTSRARSLISETAFAAASRSTPESRYDAKELRVLEVERLLEQQLRGGVLGDGDGVLAVEARTAERVLALPRGRDERLEREIRQRGRAH